ncbi:MAG: hypothetical protein SAK29_08890, partial [Scytonema sp. PMC 1069.18]|nr:hypothetical protein [Scytonema sp. PMC 1069.18]
MRERVGKGKKATSFFSVSTLRQPTRGFGLESSNVSAQAVTQQQSHNKAGSYDFSRVSMRPQAKLTVNQPGDVYEQEADNVAKQVMQRMSQPANQQAVQREQMPEEEQQQTLQTKSLANSTTPLLQREQIPEQEEEEPQLHTKSLENSTTPLLQRQQMPEEEQQQSVQAKSLA